MKATILKTKLKGVPYERGELKQTYCAEGELEIVDTRENSYNRILKIARLRTAYGVSELFEVHVLWLNGDKMCLSGFERLNVDGKVADFAQSWICLIRDQDRGRDNDNMMPPRGNFRH